MADFDSHFNANWLARLLKNPVKSMSGVYDSHPYTAHIALPYYREKLLEHYADILHGDLDSFCQHAEIPPVFMHYGLTIHFENEVELALHDDDMALNSGLKMFISQIGAVIIKNTHMSLEFRQRGHRNRFPHLNFHVDRSSSQPTHFSMYSRDPFDEEQTYPRTSSTLFIPSATGLLQAIRENIIDRNHKGMGSSFTIFTKEDTSQLRGKIILEHAWNEPQGTGELSMLDNVTSLHASFYPNPSEKGYKIGVRYLS